MQTTGSNTGTWGDVLNNQAISYIDDNLGGITSKSLTSSTNVTLTAGESRTAILRLTSSGDISGTIIITTACIGFFFVENLTTGTATITIRNASVATAATIAKGSRQTVISDATNGCRLVSGEFETGVKAPFYMSAAPVGWTRDATAALNNAAIQLVTTGGGTTGGANSFETVNTGFNLAQSNLPNVNLTTTSNGAHTHFMASNASATTDPLSSALYAGGTGNFGSSNAFSYIFRGTATESNVGLTSTNGAHTHTAPLNGGVTQTAVSLNIKYANFLVATKD